MSGKNDNASAGCGCLMLIAIAVYAASKIFGGGSSESGKKTSSTTVEVSSADPQAFDTALNLYTFPPKEKLTLSGYTDLLDEFNSFVDRGVFPEDAAFRELLLKLDGAENFKTIQERVEYAANAYPEVASQTQTVANTDAVARFREANSAYAAGDFSKARTVYIQVLELDRAHLDARNNLGLAELHAGNNVSALMHFQLVLAAEPKYLGAEMNLAVALERLGLTELAYRHAQDVVTADKKLPMAQYNLGWFQARNQEFDAAADSYAQAMKLQKDYTKAQRASVLNKLETGKKLGKTDLKSLTADELAVYKPEEVKAPAKAEAAGEEARVVTGATPKWWWWLAMVGALVAQLGLVVRASENFRENTVVWGVFSALGFLIALIVFAIWFRESRGFYNVLTGFAAANTLLMVPTSSYK